MTSRATAAHAPEGELSPLPAVRMASLTSPSSAHRGTTRELDATLGAAEAVRVVIAIALVLPVGVVLGVWFPLGMRRFGDDDKAWFWAVNGACGVLASVCSLALAMELGFRAVAWLGVAGYVAAGLLLRPARAAV